MTLCYEMKGMLHCRVEVQTHLCFEEFLSQPFVFWADGFPHFSVPLSSNIASPASLNSTHKQNIVTKNKETSIR